MSAPEAPARALPEWAEQRLKIWQRGYKAGVVINHGLALLAIASTVCSFFFAAENPASVLARALGALSIVLVAALAILAPLRNARGYIAAWRLLDEAAIKYRSNVEVPVDVLREAIQKGEGILSNRDPY